MSAFRVLCAGLYHESHSFVAGRTTLEQCDIRLGDEMITLREVLSPLGSALQAARERAWQIIPALDLRAMPGPIMATKVWDYWWTHYEGALRAAHSAGLDGIFLVLHGAMVAEGWLDVEGELLERTRRLVGPEIPIAGVTDLHANFSPRMAVHSNALVTYQKNPHTDASASARRAVGLLEQLMKGQRVTTHFRTTGIILAPTHTATDDDPMRTLQAEARALEGDSIWAINVHAGYAYADTPDTGLTFSAISSKPDTAQAALKHLAERARELVRDRHANPALELPLDEALQKLRVALQGPGSGPVLLIEPADNIGGGAPGDATHILRALLAGGFENSGVVLCDPAAVRALAQLKKGDRRSLRFGAASGGLSGEPIECEVEFLSRSDGTFSLQDRHSHLASMFGERIEMGPCAVVQTSGPQITILLTSKPVPPFDLAQWHSQGVTPEALSVIGVKAAIGHRQAYQPIARAEIYVATPGPCTSNLSLLPYQHTQVASKVFPGQPPTSGEVNLVILTPKPRSVRQRDHSNYGEVAVACQCGNAISRVEARATPVAGYAGTAMAGQKLNATSTDGLFAGRLRLEGGWYNLTLAGYDAEGEVLATNSVERIGVGEVLITAGQSNAANSGQPAQSPTDDRVCCRGLSNDWRPAKDPQPTASGTGGSPWPAFGDALAERLDVPVGILSVGIGSTRVDQWVPGAPDGFYARIQDALRLLGPDGFRAVLWHQGESDSLNATSAATYAQRLESIIMQSRRDAGFEVPWGVAIAAWHPDAAATSDHQAQVCLGQWQVITSIPNVFKGAETDSFHLAGLLCDTVHFNAAGLRAHGQQWAEALLGYIFPKA